MKSLNYLNLRELELFVIASQTKSLREVSRRSGLLPAHVSKIMKKFEEKLDLILFQRTSAGVTLTADGMTLVKTAEQILEAAKFLDLEAHRSGNREKLWTLGSISFLSSYLLAPMIGAWREQLPDTRFRLIEFTHNQLVPIGLQGAFEMAVHIGKHEWTHTWETFLVGKMAWKLYGKKGHPLGKKCEKRDLLPYRFVVPTDWHQHGYAIGEDFCPLHVSQRMKGDEASTAETALELAHGSEQLTFVPEILARSWCERGRTQEIRVEDWQTVEKEIYLTVKADKVPHKTVKMILSSLA
jgi:DNA-binding transcriptional LysR family regulator